MELLFFCPRWGSENLDWAPFCKKVKAAGYDGIEAGLPDDKKERETMLAAMKEQGLLLIGQYWQSFERDFSAHRDAFLQNLRHLALGNPVKIDAQTGKDYFPFWQNKELVEAAAEFSWETGIPVAHETHRNKALFAAHITRDYLEKIPSLQITADFSHWCNVSESFLEDQPEALAIAISRAIHIHARVGHPQSAQVTDPRLPEWQTALQHHLSWWKKIVQHQQNAGAAHLTITPEFGPAPYMPLAPRSLEPLADQWEINKWMMGYLKELL